MKAPLHGRRPPLDSRPLLDAFLAAVRNDRAPFTVPGHKGRVSRLDGDLGAVVDGDRPLSGGIDTVKLTGGHLAAAERLAAEHYGADWCRFSTGGTTHTNQALCLSVGQPGDVVAVSRSLHRSVLLGLVLAGLKPRWLPTTVDRQSGLPIGTDVRALEAALVAKPTPKAVLLTEPGYLGTLSDLPALVAVAHRAGVPVLVDQAWGAHFGFHPEVPPHALALGADALVTSVHKMLPGYSQASLVCARTTRLDVGRLERAFEATHTTSPAGSILASIDGALDLMERRGEELLSSVLTLVRETRASLRDLLPASSLPSEATLSHLGEGRFDPTRLLCRLGPAGIDGLLVERMLLEEGVSLELADRDTLVPVVTMADDNESVGRLLGALERALQRVPRAEARPLVPAASWQVRPDTAMTPRQAFFSAHETVPAELAPGRVSVELVAPYPPGIPVLAPGERITAELVRVLRNLAAEGVRVAFAADPSLESFQVAVEQREQL